MTFYDIIQNLSPQTQKWYKRRYEDLTSNNIDLTSKEKVIEFISKQSLSTQKQYYAVVSKLNPDDKEFYTNQMNLLDKPKETSTSLDYQPTPKEREIKDYILNLLHQENTGMINKIKEIPEDKPRYLKAKMALLFQIHHPLRGDFCSVKYKNFDEERDNFIKEGVLYLNNPMKIQRKIIITLHKDVDEIINKYIEQVKPKTDYIIDNQSSNTYSKFIKDVSKRYLDEELTLNWFRHNKAFHPFVQDLYHTINEFALTLNHSLETHVQKY